ncbi:hypothetical protein [Pseudoroseicyclus tamaricis]|uniref:Hemolysin type calcium-binding protein n=1 Tax=Pseudoroseicyclus tamaricis TaxID=2705421 RepID=A0A6B2JLH9_9RHOB|nr:hypothetical protein [Pseudoroseicyclus tamaricis]NDU99466.1 hypothetical protein [Pseudoroseicyclus tamaricis]
MRPERVLALLLALALLALPLRAQEAPEQPVLGMGLNGIADWSTELPFIDQMKSARPWIGHLPGQWGGMSFDELRAGGYLTPEGWPAQIPEGIEKLETFVLTDLPVETRVAAGIYLVEWEGEGRLQIGGSARDVRVGVNTARFRFAPGEGPVGIAITETDPADPIRDISVVREDLQPLHELGLIYDPDFVALVGQFRVLRFMDWMKTNGSTQQQVADRPRLSDFSWAWRGIPAEAIVTLGNAAGTDIWVTMPHLASDDYVALFASYVEEALDPRLKVYAEYSNELWNFIFPQTQWAQAQAAERWGEAAGDGWMQVAGLRAAEVAGIWAKAFVESPDRLVRVVAVHTGWPGLEAALLEAPLAVADGAAPPHESFDAYAVTGYFGHDIGSEERAEEVRSWATATDGFARAAAALRAGSFAGLLEELWPYHAARAAEYGLELVAYEGGTHVAAQGALLEDEAVTDFFTAFNYSPEMAGLYEEMFAAWAALGAGPFLHFVDVAPPSKWGSWGALRWRGDDNPRWQALRAVNASGTGAPRPAGTFAAGRYLVGTAAGERLEGSGEEDVLVGREGDDLLVPGGAPASGQDAVHGGPGDDVLLLPGGPEDWAQDGAEGLVILTSPAHGTIRAAAIERLRFAEGGERAIPP